MNYLGSVGNSSGMILKHCFENSFSFAISTFNNLHVYIGYQGGLVSWKCGVKCKKTFNLYISFIKGELEAETGGAM